MTLRSFLRRLAPLAAAALTATAEVCAAQAPVTRIEAGTHQAFINRVVALDAGRLLTVSDDQTARLWDRSGQAQAVLRGRVGPRDEGALYAVALSPRHIALGGRAADGDGYFVRVLDRTTLKPAGLLAGLPAPVTALAFAPGGDRLAVGFAGSGARVYRLGQGAPVTTVADRAPVSDLLLTEAGRLIICSDMVRLVGPDGVARAMALPTDFAPWRLALSPDGRTLAVGSRTRAAIALVDLAGGGIRHAPIAATAGDAPAVAWSEDGRRVYVGGRTAGGYVAELAADGRLLRMAETGGPPVTAIAVQPPGAVFADADGGWGAWDAVGPPVYRARPQKLAFRGLAADGLRASADGLQVSLLTADGQRVALDLATRRVRAENVPPAAPPGGTGNGAGAPPIDLEPAERLLSGVALPEGERLLGTNFYVRRVTKAGKTRWKLATPAAVWGVAPAIAARLAVAAQGDGTLAWIDLDKGALVLTAYVAPDRNWAAWTPDGFFDRSGAGARMIGHAVDRGPRDGSEFIPLDRTAPGYFRSDLVQASLRRGALDQAQLRAAQTRLGAATVKLARALPSVRLEQVCGVDRQSDKPIACFDAAGLDRPLAARRLLQPERIELTVAIDGHGAPIGATRLLIGGVAQAPDAENKLPGASGERRRYRLSLPPGDVAIDLSVAGADPSLRSNSAVLRIAGVPARQTDKPRLHVLAIGIADYRLATFDLPGGVAANDARGIAALLGQAGNAAFATAGAELLVDQQATLPAIRQALARLAAQARPEDVVLVFLSGHGQQVDGDYVFAPHELGVSGLGDAIARTKAGAAFQDEIVNQMFRADGLRRAELDRAMAAMRARRVVVVLDTCFSGSFATLSDAQRISATASMGERLAESSGRYVIASSQAFALDNASRPAAGGGTAATGNSIFTAALLQGLGGTADRDADGAVSLAEAADYVRIETPRRAAAFSVKGRRLEQTPAVSFVGDPYFTLYKSKGTRP